MPIESWSCPRPGRIKEIIDVECPVPEPAVIPDTASSQDILDMLEADNMDQPGTNSEYFLIS